MKILDQLTKLEGEIKGRIANTTDSKLRMSERRNDPRYPITAIYDAELAALKWISKCCAELRSAIAADVLTASPLQTVSIIERLERLEADMQNIGDELETSVQSYPVYREPQEGDHVWSPGPKEPALVAGPATLPGGRLDQQCDQQHGHDGPHRTSDGARWTSIDGLLPEGEDARKAREILERRKRTAILNPDDELVEGLQHRIRELERDRTNLRAEITQLRNPGRESHDLQSPDQVMPRLSVKKSDPPETTEVLAQAIVRIGEAAERLRKSGLNEDAIVILLHHKTKVGMRDIKIVLRGLRQLKGWYCR